MSKQCRMSKFWIVFRTIRSSVTGNRTDVGPTFRVRKYGNVYCQLSLRFTRTILGRLPVSSGFIRQHRTVAKRQIRITPTFLANDRVFIDCLRVTETGVLVASSSST